MSQVVKVLSTFGSYLHWWWITTSSATTSLDYNILEQQDVVVLNELETIPQALQVTLNHW
jgi:hypothetical protein